MAGAEAEDERVSEAEGVPLTGGGWQTEGGGWQTKGVVAKKAMGVVG